VSSPPAARSGCTMRLMTTVKVRHACARPNGSTLYWKHIPLHEMPRKGPMLHGHGDTVARRGVKGVEAVPAHQVLLHILQLLVREEEPCQPEVEVAG